MPGSALLNAVYDGNNIYLVNNIRMYQLSVLIAPALLSLGLYEVEMLLNRSKTYLCTRN